MIGAAAVIGAAGVTGVEDRQHGATIRDFGVLVTGVTDSLKVGDMCTIFLGEAGVAVIRVPVTAGVVDVSVLNCCGAS